MEETPNWMTPYYNFTQHKILQGDHHEARKIRIKALHFAILKNTLYQKSHMASWLKYIT